MDQKAKLGKVEPILREDWRENIDRSLLELIDRNKLSLLSSKEIKEMLFASSAEDLAVVLNLKTEISNQKAYRNYKQRQNKKYSKLHGELENLRLKKKKLTDERSSLKNDITLYKEYFSSQKL